MHQHSGLQRLALFGTLLATFSELHPLADQWAQSSEAAATKGLHGRQRVYRDGTPAGEGNEGRTDRTMAASALGRRGVVRHVTSYGIVQLSGTVAVTRALGYRVPARALLAGAAINLATHAAIDRREPLLWLARKANKDGYINHCTATRVAEDGSVHTELSGPGTALLELDQALHRAIGVTAALVTTWLATRKAAI
ncbi:hypothetical protein AB0A70_04190 [Streptomyces morookaense]|uniref:hypothetical protein n=1 Tax=Streptomyces morookaense TaxID=1970 RepID=UPI0033E89856